MDDDNTNQKKRKSKWITSYSDITAAEAEKRLGFRMEDLYKKVVPVKRMLDNSKFGGLGAEAISKTKETVYDNLVRHLLVEGYPVEGNADFGESNINDLVYIMINPIISDFIRCQCLLAMDAGDNNGGGEVYGFVTAGESWRMIKYDGKNFCLARKFEVLFEGMDQEKELWMKDYSVLVDCMYAALSNGGIVKKDVVV